MQRRSIEIDLTKGILTGGMVLNHLIKFFSLPSRLLNVIALVTSLVSFSGFFFCFGYAAYTAYLSQPVLPWSRVIRTALKCYLAFVIAGVAYLILVSHAPLLPETFLSVALLRNLPLYSEFLISFTIITLFGCAFAPVIRLSLSSARALLFACMVCGLFTFLPKNLDADPLIGLLVGGQKFNYFPVIQYLPLFLIGAFIAKNGLHPNRWLLALSALSLGLFLALIAAKFSFGRFPPSLPWLLASLCAVYLTYGVGSGVQKYAPGWLVKYLNIVGQNVLAYLLLSDLVLFTAHALGAPKALGLLGTLIVYTSLMLFILFIQYLSVDFRRANDSLQQANPSEASAPRANP